MEELVQDLVSALEQTSEQAELGELWENMVLRPLQHRRQVRKRRSRKRRCDFEHSRCLSEASESSLDEAFSRTYRHPAAAVLASHSPVLANHSDSDDTVIAKRWTPSSVSFRTRQHSWPESDSFTENTLGRSLRRRRRVKRMPPNVSVNLQPRLKVTGLDRSERTHRHQHYRHYHQRSYKKQKLGRMKKRSGAWVKQDSSSAVSGNLKLEGGWKDKILRQTKKQREATDENMSECETSSVCSSDPGLFTTDEGRQGDDEQSDWFFDGECGSSLNVPALMSSRESETAPRAATLDTMRERHHSSTFLHPAQPSQRGYSTHGNRLPGVTTCCVRKNRRRLPNKDSSFAACVDKLRHYSHDSYQKEFWLPHHGKRERNQLKPLCSLSMYPIGVVPESSHSRYSSSECKTSRQRSVQLGFLCAGDVKRRRKTIAISPPSSAYFPLCKDARQEEADQCCTQGFSPEGACALPLPSTSYTYDFGTSFSSNREQDD